MNISNTLLMDDFSLLIISDDDPSVYTIQDWFCGIPFIYIVVNRPITDDDFLNLVENLEAYNSFEEKDDEMGEETIEGEELTEEQIKAQIDEIIDAIYTKSKEVDTSLAPETPISTKELAERIIYFLGALGYSACHIDSPRVIGIGNTDRCYYTLPEKTLKEK